MSPFQADHKSLIKDFFKILLCYGVTLSKAVEIYMEKAWLALPIEEEENEENTTVDWVGK